MSEITQRFSEINIAQSNIENPAPKNVAGSRGELKFCEPEEAKNQTRFQHGRIPAEVQQKSGYDTKNSETLPKTNFGIAKESLTKLTKNEVISAVNMQLEEPEVESNFHQSMKCLDSGNKCREGHGNLSVSYKWNCYSTRTESALLKRSKKLLINLIDKELQKADAGKRKSHINLKKFNVNVNMSPLRINYKLEKLGHIQKINEELKILKDLHGFEG